MPSSMWYSPSISMDADMFEGLRLISTFGTTVRCCAEVFCIMVTRNINTKQVAAAAPAQLCCDSIPNGSLFAGSL